MRRIVFRADTAQSPGQYRFPALRLFGLIAFALWLGPSAQAANDVWDANGAIPPDGIWGTAANWVDNTVPGLNDTVTFNLPAFYTVTFNASPVNIQGLTVPTGIVTLNGGFQLALEDGGDILLNGGALGLGTPGNPFTLYGGDSTTVQNGSIVSVNHGSHFGTGGGSLLMPDNGQIIVEASSFSSGITSIGSGGTSTITYRNRNTAPGSSGNGSLSTGGTVNLGVSSTSGASGTLNVESGASIGMGSLNVGSGTAGTGTVNVVGGSDVVGQSLVSQQFGATLTVGAATGGGVGTINVRGTVPGWGPRFTTSTGAVTINATGAVNVGTGSGYGSFHAGGNVTIDGGRLTSGPGGAFSQSLGKTLTIHNGGRATFGGDHRVETNTTVTGLGSRFDFDSSVYMNAAVSVLAGADSYSENNLTIGLNSTGNGSTGTLTIDGAGSSVAARSTLTVGHSTTGSAVVNVNNGGTLSVLEAGAIVNRTGTINIAGGTANLGEHSTLSGTVSIAGGTANFGQYTTLNSTGTISLNGGTANLGELADNGGAINFTAGSLSYSGQLTVGEGGLLGQSITLLANRQLTLTAASVEPGSQVTVNGGTLNGNMTVRGSLTITSGTFAGSVSLQDSGTLNAFQSINSPISGSSSLSTIVVNGSSPVSLGSATSFAGFNHQGVMNVFHPGTVTLNSAGYARLGALTTLAGGTIAAPHGIVFASGSNFLGRGAVDARVSGEAGSVIEVNGPLALGDAASPAGFNFGGELRVREHTVTIFSSSQAALGDLTTLGGVGGAGTLNAANGLVVDFGDAITGHGTINSTNTLNKRTIINGIAQGSSPSQPLMFTGYVKGVGTFDNVVFGGTYSPGLSPTSQIVGSIGLAESGTLLMEIGGTSPGSGYDQVLASGALTLDGTLEVSLLNGFAPTSGQSFNLFDWTSVSGAFDTLTLPALAGGLAWNTSQLYTAGMLSVVSAGLSGDYNEDGVVDAADYTTWRDNVGSPTALPNDDTPGVAADDYTRWLTNYGTATPSNSHSQSIPEPASMLLALLTTAGIGRRRRGLAAFDPHRSDRHREIPSSSEFTQDVNACKAFDFRQTC